MTTYLETVANAAGLGFGAGGAFFFVRWLAVFAAGRWDKREAHLDQATRELIEALRQEVRAGRDEIATVRDRLAHVEADLIECKRLHAESEALRLRQEAALAGLGDARQHAQLIVSAERAKDK